jgi:hypothetical protein
MKNIPLEILIPVFNEGDKIIKLMQLFNEHIKTKFRVLFCYDLESDDIFNFKDELKKFNFEIEYIKNSERGPCSAIKQGFKRGNSDCVIVYPADDFLNINILDNMYSKFLQGSQIVVASRFMEGGSMVDCPMLKSILVRTASFTLYMFSSIPVRDASNGFRLFSRNLLNEVEIESKVGFAYSLELLAKCNRLNYRISEVPARWEERSEGSSKFKIFKWLPQYLKWYIYGISTTWLKRKKI